MYVDNVGAILTECDHSEIVVIGVACVPKIGVAWVINSRKELLRFSLSGEPLPAISIKARAIAISLTTRHVWTANETDILRLDSSGAKRAAFKLDRFPLGSRLAAF